MPDRAPTIFLSAAEASGDAHAAGLICALRQRLPEARFIGAAGPRMQAAGCEAVMDLTERAAMLSGAIKGAAWWIRRLRRLKRAMKEIAPDLHVPVDSPALNWHLARRAKKLEIPVVYYIAPQVWAWAPWRIRKVRRSIDRLLCILPFEEAYFRKRGVAADFVGHPLLDHLPDHPAEGELPDLLDAWRGGRWRVALLPGSREAEIRHHTAALGRVTQDIRSRWPQASCRITAVDETAARRIRRHLAGVENPPEIVTGRTAEVLGDSHFAVAASGTVTLEVAHFGVPMVVFYKVGAMMRGIYPFARRVLFRTRYLSLVNILGGRGIVPELMPWNGDATKLSGEVLDAMGDVGWLTATRRRLLQISRNLAGPHGRPAAENAADIIAEQLGMSLSDQGI